MTENDPGMTGTHEEPRRDMPAIAGLAWQWRRFIVINVVIATVLAAAISFVLPKWYRSTASILPPKDADLLNPAAAAGSMLKGLGLGGRRVGGGSLGPYNYLAILKSRSALDSVVRKFNLTQVYDVDTSIEEAVKELKTNTAFEVQDDDYITIDVLDRDPRRAADMANYFVDVLNSMSLRLGTREARNNREFIERRLEMTKVELHRSEETLRAYQERSKMVIVPEASPTASASVGGIAELFGMKAKKEIELEVLRNTVNGDDPAIAQLELELREIDRKLETFPEMGIESLRLYRDVAIQQKILEILLPLFEQAKVDEQKDVPVLLVLDRAVVAEKKTKPIRSLIVLAAFFGAAFLSVLIAFAFQRALGNSAADRGLAGRTRAWAVRAMRLYRIPDGIS